MPQNNKNGARLRGNSAGFMFFAAALHLLGIRHARRMAAIVCLYYLLFDWGAVKRTLPYVRHISPGSGFWHRLWLTYRLFVSQAWMLLEKEAYLGGTGSFEHVYHGYETFDKLTEKRQNGMILLGGHVGNWQLAVEALKTINKTINIVVHKEANEAIRKYLKINTAENNINYIFTDGPAHGAFEIASALCNGEVVCMMGDRNYETDTLEVEFLGEKAYFPYSAFAIAAKTGSPVISLFICKDWKTEIYYAYGSEPVWPKAARHEDIKTALLPYLEKYVQNLEATVKKYPDQCFIFSDVWSKKT